MDFFLWLVFTSRLSSQTTWLNFTLKVEPYCKSFHMVASQTLISRYRELKVIKS